MSSKITSNFLSDPNGKNFLSSMARNNIACLSKLRSPISSRNKDPDRFLFRSPFSDLNAPVNDPFYAQIMWDIAVSPLNVAQLISTNFPLVLFFFSSIQYIFLASAVFPELVSPISRIGSLDLMQTFSIFSNHLIEFFILVSIPSFRNPWLSGFPKNRVAYGFIFRLNLGL